MVKFEPYVPLAVALRTTGMADRHWEDIKTKTGVVLKVNEEGFNFQTVIDLGMLDHIEICQEISTRAEKEYKIREELDKMYSDWTTIYFEIREFDITFKITNFMDAIEKNDEHIIATSNLM